MSALTAIGRSIPRRDGQAKATGRAQYVDDVVLRRMAYGRILRSPHAHARIVRIDTSQAKALPGVLAVITAADVPAIVFGRRLKDKAIFARDKVRSVADAVAAVAAVDERTAARALDLIEVEYEELPAVFDALEAMEPDAPVIHEEVEHYEGRPTGEPLEGLGKNVASFTRVGRGDVERGFAEADVVVEETFHTQRQACLPMETKRAIASADLTSGRYTVWTSAPGPFRIRAQVAFFLGVPTSQVKVIPMTVGGAFGAKSDADVEIYCALLSRECGRPVKIVYSRAEEFRAVHTRHESTITLKSGVTRAGDLVAREVRIVFNSGSRANISALVTSYVTVLGGGPYRIPNLRCTGYAVYTNNIPAGSFRGYGDPQICFAYESHTDTLAARLGMDPLAFRLRNAAEDGEIMPHGQVMRSVTVRECLEAVGQELDWERARASGRESRGVGIACADSLYGGFPSSATARFNDDGRVIVNVGACEVGQGSDTVFSQIGAEAVGARVEDVVVRFSDTDTAPYDQGSTASRATYHTGNAVRAAGVELREELLQIAAAELEAAPADLRVADSRIEVAGAPARGMTFAELARVCYGRRETVPQGTGTHGSADYAYASQVEGTWYGPLATNSFQAAGAEVEVEPETGEVRVLRLVVAHDCGTAINPGLIEGQIQGGAAVGLAFGLWEELETEEGRPINGEFRDYHFPTALDVPEVEPIIIEGAQPDGPFGAKGMGDGPPVAVAAAIANAVFHATGVRFRALPLTPERVLQGLDPDNSTRS